MTMAECQSCKAPFAPGGAQVKWKGRMQRIELLELCLRCEEERMERLGGVCANCGGLIPPNSQVAVLAGPGGGSVIAHSTYDCFPPGGAYYGYWGEGRLVSCFDKIEQC